APEGVFRSRAVLHGEDPDALPGRDPAHGVGHVEPGPLLADDDRADVGLRGGLDDRVDRVADEEFHALALENFRDSRRCLHGLLSRFKLPGVAARDRLILRQTRGTGENKWSSL